MFQGIGILAVVLAAVWVSSYVGAQAGPENIPVIKIGTKSAPPPPPPPPPATTPPATPPVTSPAPTTPPVAAPAPAVAEAEKTSCAHIPGSRYSKELKRCVLEVTDLEENKAFAPAIAKDDPRCKGKKIGDTYEVAVVGRDGKRGVMTRTCVAPSS